MLQTILANVLLFGLSADPVPAPAPPEKKDEPARIRITDLENAVITFSEGTVVGFLPVMTPDGPRVRVTAGAMTLEATKLRVRTGDSIITCTATKDGQLDVSSKYDPALPVKPPIKDR